MSRKNPYSIVKCPARILSLTVEESPIEPDYFDKMLVRFRRANQLAQGYAIAAPQLGLFKRFFYYANDQEEFFAVNPEILSSSDEEEVGIEGCLSLPGRNYLVSRSVQVRWRYSDESGVQHEELATQLKARIIQHEIDHLNGLCLDRFKEA